uniref:SDR family NAD(P)-dependent oxidoreductase n=1 Tax=Desertifilum tharense IPPAS B-1220 TaxID=1781255 RepID=A0ACD5GRN1_9CYAN
MRLIVVGRSPEPPPESPATLGIEDIQQLRQILLTQARQAAHSPTPVQIETQIQQVWRDRAIRQNLQALRQFTPVDYRAVDVTQEEAFGGLIQEIYRQYGRLDAAIHGAGIIEDKLIVDKHPDSFDRVFNTKADSAFLLSRYLQPESLKLLVFFGSVAGRYGNRGQGDYAAANEVVNRLYLAVKPPLVLTARVVAINWVLWDTTGMASEAVKQRFRERGIIPISLSAGCQFFLEEVCFGSREEVEIVAGEGPWSDWEAIAVSHPFVLLPVPSRTCKPTIVLS